jgi:hypothetical protein
MVNEPAKKISTIAKIAVKGDWEKSESLRAIK